MGAWIEIAVVVVELLYSYVAPHVGARIEIGVIRMILLIVLLVAPLAGARIEMTVELIR